MELEPTERSFLRHLIRMSVYMPLIVLSLIGIGCYLADYFFWQA